MSTDGKIAVILAAAGKSTRFQHRHQKKPFADLKGRAVWLRSADLFQQRADVGQLIIVVAPDDLDMFRTRFQPNLAFMDIDVVPGGAERADSVRLGLAAVREGLSHVAVHDAARPLVPRTCIDEVFRAAREHGSAILATRCTSTLKRESAQRTIAETVDRSGLWLAQTPQVFARELLEKAYRDWQGGPATDEAQMVERTGARIQLVEGSSFNLKITTQEDFRLAEALVDALPKPSVPRALHPFADESPFGL